MHSIGVAWRKLSQSIIRSHSDNSLRKTFRNVVDISFSSKYLIFTNVAISASLSSLGDLIEQKYEMYMGDLEKYQWRRNMHMASAGAVLGVLCHNCYRVLDKYLVGKTFSVIIKKLTVDQVVFSPIMIATFFGSVALFEDNPWVNFKEEVKHKFVLLYKAEWMVWPPAQVVNFCFLPTKYRVLYDNTISLGYDIYTSQVKHRKLMLSEIHQI